MKNQCSTKTEFVYNSVERSLDSNRTRNLCKKFRKYFLKHVILTLTVSSTVQVLSSCALGCLKLQHSYQMIISPSSLTLRKQNRGLHFPTSNGKDCVFLGPSTSQDQCASISPDLKKQTILVYHQESSPPPSHLFQTVNTLDQAVQQSWGEEGVRQSENSLQC